MNETLLTISILIIVACNLAVLLLWFKMKRNENITIDFADSDESDQIHEVRTSLHELHNKLDKFIRNTDYDFRALKTRERNQEKAHRRAQRTGVQP